LGSTNMTALFLAILFTLAVSGICSLMEAFILSVTAAEIEGLKKSHLRRGRQLERYKNEMEETSTSILTLNTIANTLGSILIGVLARDLFSDTGVGVVVGGMVLAILIFSEIIPKNLGVIYRTRLMMSVTLWIGVVRFVMMPLAGTAKFMLLLIIRDKPVASEAEQEAEIILLAEKHAEAGALTSSERDMISNTLNLDNVNVSEVMTPRTVVTFLRSDLSVDDVFESLDTIPFARIPVYEETIDNIVGLIRRRELLRARGNDEDSTTVSELMAEISHIPENATAADALQLFLKNHQQFAVVVDEFGSTAGVVSMEDIFEQILGKEIFEEDDVAVDMRELARAKAREEGAEEPMLPGGDQE